MVRRRKKGAFFWRLSLVIAYQSRCEGPATQIHNLFYNLITTDVGKQDDPNVVIQGAELTKGILIARKWSVRLKYHVPEA